MVAVILTCYGLAVSEGHVPAWLPTISSCGDYPPEKFVFTYGVIVVAALLFVESLCLYGADKPYSHSLLILVVSAVAAFFLGVVGSVCSKCDSAVHDCERGLTCMTLVRLYDFLRSLCRDVLHSGGRVHGPDFDLLLGKDGPCLHCPQDHLCCGVHCEHCSQMYPLIILQFGIWLCCMLASNMWALTQPPQ